jgi:hypothetical protein
MMFCVKFLFRFIIIDKKNWSGKEESKKKIEQVSEEEEVGEREWFGRR